MNHLSAMLMEQFASHHAAIGARLGLPDLAERAKVLREAKELPAGQAGLLVQHGTRSWQGPVAEVSEVVGALRSSVFVSGGVEDFELIIDGEHAGGVLPDWMKTRVDRARRITLTVRRGCGGDVREAVEIGQLIAPKLVEARVENCALSASAILFSTARCRRVMRKGARLLLHQCTAVVMADPARLREIADQYDALQRDVFAALSARTGRSLAEVEDWHRPGQDAIFTAEAAVEAGLADEIA